MLRRRRKEKKPYGEKQKKIVNRREKKTRANQTNNMPNLQIIHLNTGKNTREKTHDEE